MNQTKPNLKKVAIIGCSSQVGSSVALYFKKYNLAEPVCFIRSLYSKSFFDLLDIKTIVYDLSKNDLNENLNGFHAVIDFTFPTGHTFEIPDKIKFIASNFIKNMPKEAVYIYMSSIMAFGMPDLHGKIEHYSIPRGTYGLIKRKAEKYTKRYEKKTGVSVYNFRLGQVHGFLQSVNSSFRQKMKENEIIHLNANENDFTNTIFISTLGDAILKCINKTINPGTYTLVSSPQWTISELYGYYKKYYDLDSKLVFHKKNKITGKSGIKAKALGKIKKLKPLIESYLLMWQPKLSIRLKGKYRIMESKQQVYSKSHSYSDYHILGALKYRNIKNLDSSLGNIFSKEKEMQAYYESFIEKKKDGK